MQRLKTRGQFQAVLSGGKIAATSHFVLHRCMLNGPHLSHNATSGGSESIQHPMFSASDVWIGAMVPKRWAKRSVTRNCIKRQIYNVSSEFESALPLAAHVVRLRSGFDRKSFISASSDLLKTAVRAELLQLFSRATSVLAPTAWVGAAPP